MERIATSDIDYTYDNLDTLEDEKRLQGEGDIKSKSDKHKKRKKKVDYMKLTPDSNIGKKYYFIFQSKDIDREKENYKKSKPKLDHQDQIGISDTVVEGI